MNDDHFLTFPAVALNLKIMISYVRKNFHSLNSDLLMGFSPQMQYVDTSLHYTKIRCSKIAGWLVSLNMKTTHGHRKMQNEKKKNRLYGVFCIPFMYCIFSLLYIWCLFLSQNEPSKASKARSTSTTPNEALRIAIVIELLHCDCEICSVFVSLPYGFDINTCRCH